MILLIVNIKCSKCLRLLDENEFNWKFKFTKRSYHCKNCSRTYVKHHYMNNRSYYLNKAKIRSKKVKDYVHRMIGNYLLAHPCVDCGESDLLVLEFDHIDRSTKLGEVARIVKRKLSANKIMEEISKCEVRCANCHRRKTEIESLSWKVNFSNIEIKS